MAHLSNNTPSWLEGRDENIGNLYTSPVDTINGSFAFPRQYPLNFRETSLINITWTTQYEGVNLYYYQRGKVAESTQIATNLATSWYQWQVFAEETNLTEPYVFHMVNARGTTFEQTQQGFWSTSFYILRDEAVSSSSSSSSSSSTSTSPSTLISSSTTELASTTMFSTSATATIDSADTSATSTDLAPVATQTSHGGLSTGAIAGIAVAGVVVAVLLGLAGFCHGRRKVRRAQPAVLEPTIETAEPAPAYWKHYAQPQEMYGHPLTAQEQKPVYELPPGRN